MPTFTIRTTATATIASGSSDSGTIDAAGSALKRIHIPAGTDGVAMTVLHSADGSTFLPARDRDNNAIAFAFTAGSAVELEPALLPGMQWFKLRTLSNTGSQTQSADRVFSVVCVE